MRASLATAGAVACLSGASCFTVPPTVSFAVSARRQATHPATRWVAPRMTAEDGEAKGALVPVSPENIEFSAGVVGGLAGFIVGGPLLAAILATAANYSAKREGDVGVAIRGVAKSAIETFNFMTSINSKYAVTDKASSALSEAVDKLKSTDDSKTIEKVEQTLLEATSKVKTLTSEYDLVAKGKQALGVVGELADTAIDKTVELEKEYKVTEKVKEAAVKAIDNAKSASA